MICQNAKDLMHADLDGQLPEDQRQALLSHCEQCPECKREFSELTHLLDLMSRMPDEEPSPRLRHNFQAMLREEIALDKQAAKPRPSWYAPLLAVWREISARPALQLSYSLCLLLVGMLVGSRFLAPTQPASSVSTDTQRELAALRGKIDDMGQLVAYSLVKQESDNARLRRVAAVLQQGDLSKEQLGQLVGTLAFDPSTNVRLSALEALYTHSDNSAVRDAVLASLPKEQSPLVQMRMIDFLSSLRESQAAPAFEALTRDEKTDKAVREAARRALAQL